VGFVASYCQKGSVAGFLARAAIDGDNSEILLQSLSRYYRLLPCEQQEVFRSEVAGQGS
jgi:hypothetical protein